jgi:hypothetical protein
MCGLQLEAPAGFRASRPRTISSSLTSSVGGVCLFIADEDLPATPVPSPKYHPPDLLILAKPSRWLRTFLHFIPFRVDAAWPRLGRAFRTAPVSRQTNPDPVWHSPRFHSRPATLPRPPFCPFHRSRLVSSRCRSSEGRNKPKTAEREKQ